MIKIQSSNIEGVEYKDGNLRIIFKNGKQYLYHGVKEHIYNDFMDSESKGKFATEHIYAKYPYSMVLIEENKKKKDLRKTTK